MIALAGLIDQHGDDIDADFRRYYGLDVADVGTPGLTWRRLGALVNRLPREGCYARAVVGAEEAEWTTDRHLLASVVDHLRGTNYLLGGLLVANGAKRNPVPPPEPIKRPGVEMPAGERKGKGFKALAEKMGARPTPRLT
ncbi:hypothetical protein ACWDRR_00670 [Kitasatospora sp. NPDC003701]